MSVPPAAYRPGRILFIVARGAADRLRAPGVVIDTEHDGDPVTRR
ncbi:hypothetical protein [Kitasatospora sp. NPDC093102]